MPTTQSRWRQICGWLNHFARFIWRGHEVLATLREVQAHPLLEHWQHFLSLLHHYFVQCVIPSSIFTEPFTMIISTSKIGWGAILLAG